MSIKETLRERIDDVIWTADWLREKVDSDDPKIRLWAFNRLTYCYPDRAVEAAREHIADDDVFLRQTATSHIGSHGEPSDGDLLKEKYPEAEAAWKGTIMNALAELGDEEMISYGEELLSEESVNINLVLSFIEALKKLDTQRAESTAQDVYQKTRTEAVFSSLTGYFLRKASPGELGNISSLVLAKLSDNVMLKIRHFCSQVRDVLYMYTPSTTLPELMEKTDTPATLLREFADSMNIQVPESEDLSSARTALERYMEGEVTAALDQIGQWGQERATEHTDEEDLRRREMAGLLSGYADPPEELEDLDVPGRPRLRLFQLALNAWAHYYDTPHPFEELEDARSADGFPGELYQRESPFLVDEIALLGSKRDPDPSDLLEDAANDEAFFRRLKALKILSLMDEEEVIPELIRALNSSNKLMYRTGARALIRFGPAAVEHLDRAIDGGDLEDGLVTAADVLRRIPTSRSAEVFLDHFDRFMAKAGVDPIVSFSVDLAVPETADALRSCLDRHLLMVGEQLGIVCHLYDLDFPEEERIQNEMEKRSERNQGGPQTGGSPFPGGGGPPMPGSSGPDLPDNPSIPT